MAPERACAVFCQLILILSLLLSNLCWQECLVRALRRTTLFIYITHTYQVFCSRDSWNAIFVCPFWADKVHCPPSNIKHKRNCLIYFLVPFFFFCVCTKFFMLNLSSRDLIFLRLSINQIYLPTAQLTCVCVCATLWSSRDTNRKK